MASNLSIPFGDESLLINPVANGAIPTHATMNVSANSAVSGREFMAAFGLNAATGGGDKVGVFSGVEALPGTSDCWTYYSTLGMNASSGSYNAICYEADLNNANGHRGNTGNLTTDFTQVNAVGLSVTGNSVFSSTSAILLSSQNQTGSGAVQWNRGITLAGQYGFCSIQDWATVPVGIQFDGTYSAAAINMASLYGNTGANTATALLCKNNQSVAWQTADTTSVVSMKTDVTNNMLVGVGAANVIVAAPLSPFVPGAPLGTGTNFWGAIFSNVGVVSPSDLELKENVTPLPPMSAHITQVTPIRYQLIGDDAWHYGFDAGEIRNVFEPGYAAYREADGVGHLAKDELIAVLWEALHALMDRVAALEFVGTGGKAAEPTSLPMGKHK